MSQLNYPKWMCWIIPSITACIAWVISSIIAMPAASSILTLPKNISAHLLHLRRSWVFWHYCKYRNKSGLMSRFEGKRHYCYLPCFHIVPLIIINLHHRRVFIFDWKQSDVKLWFRVICHLAVTYHPRSPYPRSPSWFRLLCRLYSG